MVITRIIVLLCGIAVSLLCPSIDHAGHWSPPAYSPVQMHLAGNDFRINGAPAKIGDEVAVVDSTGNIVGHFVVVSPGRYGDMVIYGDSLSTLSVDEGAFTDEPLSIRVWDAEYSVEYDADPTIPVDECSFGYCPPVSLPLKYSSDSFYLLNVSGGKRYVLTTGKSGSGTGAITSSPAGISCTLTCSGNYISGTPVTLTATADNGSTFTGWSGGGCQGTGPCTIALNADTTITAFFLLGNILAGDLNNDKTINLLDAILAFQAFVGLNPPGIRADYATSATDVNGDNQIGLAEIIYILQRTAGLR